MLQFCLYVRSCEAAHISMPATAQLEPAGWHGCGFQGARYLQAPCAQMRRGHAESNPTKLQLFLATKFTADRVQPVVQRCLGLHAWFLTNLRLQHLAVQIWRAPVCAEHGLWVQTLL